MYIAKKLWKPLITLSGVVAIVMVAFWAADLVRESESIRQVISSYGYLGVFIVSLISGFNLVVPIPAISFLPLFLEAGLNFNVTILTMTVGMTIADLIAFVVGKSGRQIASETNAKKILPRISRLKEKYDKAPLVLLFFFAAFVPFPNEILLIPLGFLGYRSAYVLPILLAGNTVFNILTAIGVINLFAIL